MKKAISMKSKKAQLRLDSGYFFYMFYFIFLFFVVVSLFHSIHHYFSLPFMFHNFMLHHVSSLEHILPDNLFASPKKSAGDPLTVFSAASVEADENTTSTTSSSLNIIFSQHDFS